MLRRATGLGTALLMTACVIMLAGCNVGYDAGITHRCAMTFKLDDAKSYVDQTDCPGDPHVIVNSGNAWILGSNAPKPGGSHCGDPGLAYKINGANSPLQMGWTRANSAYTVDMSITKDACADNTEITFGMFNGTSVAAAGLKTTNDIRIVSRANINHVNVAAYVTDQNGNKWTLAVVFRPTSGNDPRWNNPAAGVFFKGSSGHADTHLILLDGSYFGAPRLCSGCDFQRVQLDWTRLFQFVQNKGWRSALWPVFGTARASVALQIQTFDNGSRIHVQHRGWTMDGNA